MSNNASAKYSILKRKYNQKEEENLCLREQIREYQCNRCSSSGVSQATLTKLEMERDSAKGDCMRLREENNAIRDDLQRMKESQRSEQMRLEQAQKDFDNCVAQFEVERAGLCTQIKQLSEELRQCKDRVRDVQGDATDQRTRCNHLKMVNEQTERELRTTQDLLQQTEAELASALDRIQELTDENKQREWELKEARQEKICIKANLARLDQEKDSLLLKVDEKTEQNVRLEAELDSRDRRIASLESFIADLQKKLDVALDTAARSEQSSRQNTLETDRLRKELDKMERCRDNAIKENSRLQNDLAALTRDYKENSRELEATRREVEDLKLQLQGYVAEARRVNQMLEEKEAERMAMLEHFRSLTVESANLETNNHSLESEARSTKSCLREAQTRLQELESKLQEKRTLCCGYEKQIKELTQQVAKLERKLDSRSRAESATRDMSRELETQKHCLSQKMEQLAHDKKELEEEVCQLREELCRLQEQLGKERKNSATLENVLASAKQETLQRTKDNGELRAQVHSLQAKLRDLQDKLEHGCEALRRCQTECKDYQSQVSELKREVTNERFERARVEETKRKPCCLGRPLKGVLHRSHSLTSLHSPIMSSSFVCPCCFLNRISSLRNTPESSWELMNQEAHSYKRVRCQKDFTYTSLNKTPNDKAKRSISSNSNKSCSDVSNLDHSSVSLVKFDIDMLEGEVHDFLYPERLVNNSTNCQSSETFTLEESNLSLMTVGSNISQPASSVQSRDRAVFLAEQIDCMLQEQRQFLRELELPVNDDGGFRLKNDQLIEVQVTNEGDSIKVNRKIMSKANQQKKQRNRKGRTGRFTNEAVYFASGDQDNISNVKEGKNCSDDPLFESLFNVDIVKPLKKHKKLKDNLKEEPVKLSKKIEWAVPLQTSLDFNKNHNTEKNISVKMIFCPDSELKCSSSSIESSGEAKSLATTSSAYVTAVNSYNDGFREFNTKEGIYTIAGLPSNLSVNVTSSESRGLLERE